MMQLCPACKGTYNDKARDGSDYLHACPPLSAIEAEAVVQGCTVGKVPCDAITGAFIPTPQGKALTGTPRTAAQASLLTGAAVVNIATGANLG